MAQAPIRKSISPMEWQAAAAQSSARTVYIEDSQHKNSYANQASAIQHHQAQLTNTRLTQQNKFNETLPLITDCSDIHQKSSQNDQNSQRAVLPADIGNNSTNPNESQVNTTFEDYRHNMQTGSMQVMSDSHSVFISRGGQKYTKGNAIGTQVSQQLSASYSKQSLQSQRSKGILPTLARSNSPSAIIQDVQQEPDPIQQQRIKESLNFSSFQGQELVSRSVDAKMPSQKWYVDYPSYDELANSVTLKDGWRKAMLPGIIDLRNQKQQIHGGQSSMVGNDGLATQIMSARVPKKLDHRERQKLDHEKKRIQSLVNEGNIAGRQSVRNLLQIYTPNVEPLARGAQSLQTNTNNNSRLNFLPALDQYSMQSGSNRNDYQIKIESNNLSTLTDQRQLTNLSQFSRNHFDHSQSQSPSSNNAPNPSKNSGARKTTLRNSEGYVLYRSQVKPVKRVILHKDQHESPIQNKAKNTSFTQSQLINATTVGTNVGVARSVSPFNYDNGLGYAPRTINIFNSNKAKKEKKNKNNHQIMIADKVLNKDNIFVSVAQTEASPKQRYKRRQIYQQSQQKQPEQVNDYSMTMHLPSMVEKQHFKIGQSTRQLISHTETPSVASLHQSTSSLLSTSHHSDNSQNNKVKKNISFKVQNKKDWAPLELASRSQLYLNSSTPQAETPNLEHHASNNAFASLLENKSNNKSTLSSNRLESYIKVSNMKGGESQLDIATLEEDEKMRLQPIDLFKLINEKNLKVNRGEMPDYADLPRTSRNEEQQSMSKTNRQDYTLQEQNETIIDVANQGTQAIEETNSEDFKVQNEEEWANEVVELVNQQSYDSPIYNSRNQNIANHESDSKRLLINVQSTKLIPDQDYVQPQQDKLKVSKHYSSVRADQDASKAESRAVYQTSDAGFGPPMSSTSTMQLNPLSPTKRTSNNFVETSMDKPRLNNMSLIKPQTSSRHSLNRQNSNQDIQDVLEETSEGNMMKSKPITMTDFKQKGMQSSHYTIKLDPNQSEFNRSQLVLKIGKAGFAAGFAMTGQNLRDKSGLAIQGGQQQQEEQTEETSGDQEYSVVIENPMPNGIVNSAMHPILLEALKKTKQVKFQKSIRSLSKKAIAQKKQPQKVYIGISQDSVPTVVKEVTKEEKGTVAMTNESYSLINLDSVKNSQSDTDFSPIKRLMSMLEQQQSLDDSPLKIPSIHLLSMNNSHLQTLNESVESQDDKTPGQSPGTQQNMRFNYLQNEGNVNIPDQRKLSQQRKPQVFIKEHSGITSGVAHLQTSQQISPRNLELNLSPHKSKQATNNTVSSAKLQKFKLAKNGSMVSLKRDPGKKVTFTNKNNNQIFTSKDIENAQRGLAPMMHILQIVKNNRYDMPILEKKSSATQLNMDLTMNGAKNKLSGPINLNHEDIKEYITDAHEGFDTRKSSQADDSRRQTQVQFSSEGGNIATQMRLRDTNSPVGFTISATKDIVVQTNEFGFKDEGVKTLESVYPLELKESILRRSAEKFLPKFQLKMMILKPLRTRKNTSSKDQVVTLSSKNKNPKTQHGSISTVQGPIEQILTKNNVDQSKPSTISSRNKNSKQNFKTIESKQTFTEAILDQNVPPRFDSKGSKLSGDLEHLADYSPYLPGMKIARIHEDPLEKTQSNFSHSKSNLDEKGTVLRTSKIDLNGPSTLTIQQNSHTIQHVIIRDVEHDNLGGLLVNKQSSEGQRADGSSQLMMPQADQQRVMQIQTSLGDLQQSNLMTASNDRLMTIPVVDLQSTSGDQVTFKGSETPRSSVQRAKLISIDAQYNITPVPHIGLSSKAGSSLNVSKQ